MTFYRLTVLMIYASALLTTAPVSAAILTDKRGLMTFELTIENPKPASVALTAVNLINDPSGEFSYTCKNVYRMPQPLSDYSVKLPVSEIGEFGGALSPPVIFSPHEIRTITISVLPDVGGTCGDWSATVQLRLKFSDGTSILSSKQKITLDDVKKQSQNTPDDDKLLAYLRHPRSALRIQGIDYLVESDLSLTDKTGLLRHKLEDPEESVRYAAVLAAGTLHINSLEPQIEELLKAQPTDSDVTGYLVAISRTMSPDSSVSVILDRLDKCLRYPDCYEVSSALASMNRDDVRASIRSKLNAELDRVSSDTDYFYLDGTIYLFALIEARDMEGSNLIMRIFSDERFDYLASFALEVFADRVSHFEEGYGRILSSELVDDPFITQFRSEYAKRFKACDDESEAALMLLVMTGASDEDVNNLVEYGLKCGSPQVSGTAAHIAAFFGIEQWRVPIQKVADSWGKGSYPFSYALMCRSLMELGGKCLAESAVGSTRGSLP